MRRQDQAKAMRQGTYCAGASASQIEAAKQKWKAAPQPTSNGCVANMASSLRIRNNSKEIDMQNERLLTLDEILLEPIIRKRMAADGVSASDIRDLYRALEVNSDRLPAYLLSRSHERDLQLV